MSDNLGTLFPDFNGGEEAEIQIEKITVNKDGKEIVLSLFCDTFMPKTLESLREFLKGEYSGFDVSLEARFPREAFCGEVFDYIVKKVVAKGLPVNGFFNGSKITVEGADINVELTHGGLSVLETMEFERVFSAEVNKCFGFVPKLVFSGVTEMKMEEMKPLSEPSSLKSAAPLDKPKRPKNALSARDMKNKQLLLDNEEYTPVIGKKPSLEAIKPLIDMVGDGGRCTVWGDVFFTETRETRNGNTVYTVAITDYTSSINMKVFDRNNEFKAIGTLAAGETLVVAGEIAHDRYENEFVLNPRDIIKVTKKCKKDTAERKRTELHLHTNMSSMDAIPDAGSVVRRAAAFGHHAVAITDHGVVQAFPDAAAALGDARKLVPDFKIIYGVECYYVDDSVKAVSGLSDLPIEGEIVCFD
ncbi:MAG: PHP domain-containing protein, partial [Ruminococcaceae bacterium]|nr:PHP domain-containing protein [Oscillospiraceae bacterium]